MAYDVRTGSEEPRPLAAVRAETTQPRLGADIVRLLDLVWPVLREQGVRTDHNIVVYREARAGVLTVDVGVEVLSDFTPRDQVQPAATPAGEVATTAHYGEYSELAGAYAALERWCAEHQRQPSGVSWEVYGDWAEDPAERRTDIYFLLRPGPG